MKTLFCILPDALCRTVLGAIQSQVVPESGGDPGCEKGSQTLKKKSELTGYFIRLHLKAADVLPRTGVPLSAHATLPAPDGGVPTPLVDLVGDGLQVPEGRFIVSFGLRQSGLALVHVLLQVLKHGGDVRWLLRQPAEEPAEEEETLPPAAGRTWPSSQSRACRGGGGGGAPGEEYGGRD